MVVVFDCSFLSLLLHPTAAPPTDPTTGQPVEQARARIELLVKELDTTGDRIVIPTPALGEFLVLTDEAGPDYLATLTTAAVFQIAPFDLKASVEAAAAQRLANSSGDKRSGASGTWQAIKIDRQIVAIAKTIGADRVYSDDQDIANMARQAGLTVVSVVSLPLPPLEPGQLPFELTIKASDEADSSSGSVLPSEQSRDDEPV